MSKSLITVLDLDDPVGDDMADLNSNFAMVNPDKLQKASDDSFETAVVGTEYYSPNQHGGIYGTVYRQYLAGTLATESNGSLFTGTPATLATIATGLTQRDVSITVSFGTSEFPGGFANSATVWVSSPRYDSGGTIKTVWGSAFDASTYTAWIDYTK